MDTRTLARAIAVGRLGFGIALVAAPRLLTSGWVGEDAHRAGVQAVATGLGARDLVLAAGVLSSLSRGGAKPWVAASATADLGDLVGTLRCRRELPAMGVIGLTLIAGGSAALGAYLSAQDDW